SKTLTQDLPEWKGDKELSDLAKALQSPAMGTSETRTRAEALARQFKSLRESLLQSPAETPSRIRALLKRTFEDQEKNLLNWDEAGQAYMAMLSLQHDRERANSGNDEAITKAMNELRDKLAMPLQQNSPANYSPVTIADLFKTDAMKPLRETFLKP